MSGGPLAPTLFLIEKGHGIDDAYRLAEKTSGFDARSWAALRHALHARHPHQHLTVRAFQRDPSTTKEMAANVVIEAIRILRGGKL